MCCCCFFFVFLGALSPVLEVTGRKYQRQLGNSLLTTQGRARHRITLPVGAETLQRETGGGRGVGRRIQSGKSAEQYNFFEDECPLV